MIRISKDTTKEVFEKTIHKMGENFANYVLDESLVSKILKEFL